MFPIGDSRWFILAGGFALLGVFAWRDELKGFFKRTPQPNKKGSASKLPGVEFVNLSSEEKKAISRKNMLNLAQCVDNKLERRHLMTPLQYAENDATYKKLRNMNCYWIPENLPLERIDEWVRKILKILDENDFDTSHKKLKILAKKEEKRLAKPTD